MITTTIKFPALDHYKMLYNSKEKTFEFKVFFTPEKYHTYPFDKKAGAQLADMVDEAIKPKLKEGTNPDFVLIDHNVSNIKVTVFITKDGEKIQEIINL